jgi:hypothetical protein
MLSRLIIATAALLMATVAHAQVEVRPPVAIPTIPRVVAPPVAAPIPPSLNIPAAPVPTPPAPVPTPPLEAASPPPPPPDVTGGDSGDGPEACDCYVTEQEPVYENGEIVSWTSTRKWSGKSPDCCPD